MINAARLAVVALLGLGLAPDAARAQAVAADSTGPARVDSLLAAGRAASARGDHAGAWSRFRRAFDPAADDPRVLASLAGAAASLEDLPRFLALLDSVIGPGPGGPHALEYWAALSLDGGEPATAVRVELDEYLAARPGDVGGLLAFARVLLAHRLPDVAAELLESAVERGVERSRVAIALGDARREQGDAEGALGAWLEGAADPAALERMRALLAERPPGHARDPLVERLRRARAGSGPGARVAATLLDELARAATDAGPEPAPPSATCAAATACGADGAIAAARDTTELAAALGRRGPAADPRLIALYAGDLWLARGAADSAIATYARAVDRATTPDLGAPAIDALARIRLVRALARAPRARLARLGTLLVEAPADPGGAAARLDSLAAALALADTTAARPFLAALAAEWRGRAGDAAGASAALEAAAATAGAETPALLLAAGRWAAVAREDERARALWRAVVLGYGETPYALEARRLLARPESESR